MMGAKDGERGSYPEIVAWRAREDRRPRSLPAGGLQRPDLQRRRPPPQPRLPLVGQGRLVALPAYDLNPVPTDVKGRVLTTNIDLDEGTYSLNLLEARRQVFWAHAAAGARDH
jgi:serine/threonine-protein kinase HipA